jgi:hypothetical protein
MEKSVQPEAFGPGRTVVEVEFTDQPEHKRRWLRVSTLAQVRSQRADARS